MTPFWYLYVREMTSTWNHLKKNQQSTGQMIQHKKS